jgi:hypothetical protein
MYHQVATFKIDAQHICTAWCTHIFFKTKSIVKKKQHPKICD